MACKTPLLGSELYLRSWRLSRWFERLCLSRCLETFELVVFLMRSDSLPVADFNTARPSSL